MFPRALSSGSQSEYSNSGKEVLHLTASTEPEDAIPSSPEPLAKGKEMIGYKEAAGCFCVL